MMSYMWIFVLASLMVTGVKMQEDGVEGAENTEPAADDITPEEDKEQTVSDDDDTGTEDLPQDTDDTSLNGADGEGKVDPTGDPEENTEEAPPTADAAVEDQPVSQEPKAAEEEPVEGETSAETAEGDTVETEAPPSVEPEVTEPVIIPVDGPGEAEETPEDEETEQDEPAEGEPAGGEEVTPTDAGETDLIVTEEPKEVQEDEENETTGFRLSDAFDPDDGDTQAEEELENTIGDTGHGKARSAGSASDPNAAGGGSGTVVGVVCGIAVAAVGAIAGYFTHQKKKLCFKAQRADPESVKVENGTQNDPQVSSSLLNSSSFCE